MSLTSRPTVVRWPVPIALAIPALAAAIFVTFTPGHTVWFGYLVVAAFAVLTAAAAGVGIAFLPSGPARAGAIAKTVVASISAATALLLLSFSAFSPVGPTLPAGEVGTVGAGPALGLSLTIAGTFAAFAAIDLIVGIGQRRADRYARDWIATGVIQGAAALVVLIVPPAFYQAFSFTEKSGEIISGAVTSSTMIVGIFGAATAILGVFLAIAGVGLIPERTRREQAST